MLEVQNLSMRFGGLLAVDQVSLDVQEREIVSIIGPNGAGKTTVFNCISGFYKPTGGKILFVLSYGGYVVQQFIDTGRRFDQPMVDHLDKLKVPCVDSLARMLGPSPASHRPAAAVRFHQVNAIHHCSWPCAQDDTTCGQQSRRLPARSTRKSHRGVRPGTVVVR